MLFFETLQNLCRSKQITPTEMAKKIGISTAMPTNWKNGQIPNGETLIKLSEFFGVSVDYLLGKETPVAGNDFTYALYDELAHDLSEDQLQQLKQFADFLRSKNKST